MPTSTRVLVELPFPSEHLEMTHQHRAKLTAFKHENLQNVASALVHGPAPAGGSVFTFQLAYTVCKCRSTAFFIIYVWRGQKGHGTSSPEARFPATALAIINSSCYFLICKRRALRLRPTTETLPYLQFLDYSYTNTVRKRERGRNGGREGGSVIVKDHTLGDSQHSCPLTPVMVTYRHNNAA